MTKAPTPAQIEALKYIRDGKVHRYFPHFGSAPPKWSVVRKPGHPRSDTITRVVSAGWAVVGPRTVGKSLAPVTITDAGKAALGNG